MKKIKSIFKFGVTALMLFFMLIPNCKAQIPINDPAWIINNNLSDDFYGTTLNTSKWVTWDSTYQHGLGMDFNRNLQFSGDTLIIHADTLNPNRYYKILGVTDTFRYQASEIQSIDTSFKYGYYEISAKYPVGNKAYWPAFWLWNGGDCSSYSKSWYNEIDITENGGTQSFNGHEVGINMHWANPNSCYPFDQNVANTVTGLPLLNSTFHKYACQWDVNNLAFYFDDSLVLNVPNSVVPNFPHHLNLNLDFYIDSSQGILPHMPSADFKIDYFHYYKLNIDCQNTLTISNPSTDYYNASPARAVKKSITTVTVGGTSPTFNLSDDCTLRATDYILLDAGTTITGTGTGQFSAIITPCPQ